MNFIKTVLASFTGFLLGLILLFIIGFFFIINISISSKSEPYISNNSVLTIDLLGNIPDRTTENPIDKIFRNRDFSKVSLKNLKMNLDKAATDKRIKGVWLRMDYLTTSWATLEDVHDKLIQFRKKSGKFIYCSTGDIGYNEKSYYVATAADSIFSPPESYFEFDGFYLQTTFYKGLMDKIGIEPEISREGKYKSAVEPYLQKNYSEANKQQLSELLKDINASYLKAVSERSGHPEKELENWLNEAPHITAEYAMQKHFIDGLLYPEEVISHIKQRLGFGEDSDLNTVSFDRYTEVSPGKAGINIPQTNNRIAVIYAEGEIVPLNPNSSPLSNTRYITAKDFRHDLDRIEANPNVKALVVRVNSPGGSGSTSDLIWKMLEETKKKMPVIVSMGSVAASGGYYMSVAADTIVAMPNTITGSIGVFGTKFNAKKLFNDKLGVTFDVVKSSKNADWLLQTKPFTDSESKAFQHYIDNFYETFVSRVATSRGLRPSYVDSIAQGRIWTGQDALKEHLVDVLGDLDDAISIAAQKAGVQKYTVIMYPKPKSFIESFAQSLDTKASAWFDSFYPGEHEISRIARYIHENPRQVQALLPVTIDVQ